MILLSPYFLLLLLFIPSIIYFYIKNRKRTTNAILYSKVGMSNVLLSKKSFKAKDIPFSLIMVAIFLSIIALSRPVIVDYKRDAVGEGIYISLVLDVSPSMLGEDMSPTRLEVAKNTLIKFINDRQFDKISLVTFAMKSSVISPSTFDYNDLISRIEKIDIDYEGSTSIGVGIVTAVDMLRSVPDYKGDKIIILLTDGDNNAGEIEPSFASEIASLYGIKVYTIGLGKPGISYVWITIDDPVKGKNRVRMPFQLNEEVLISIAKKTGGKYFNASNSKTLSDVYSVISKLEKQSVSDDSAIEYFELYRPFLMVALFLVFIAWVLKTTKYLIIP